MSREYIRTWVLELKGGKGRKKVWGKKEESNLLIRAVNIERHPPRLRIRVLPRVV